MDYETGKLFENVQEAISSFDQRLKMIEEKLGLNIEEKKEENKTIRRV
jgi:hypothetical protein